MNARTARLLREYSEATHSDYKKLKRGWRGMPHQARPILKDKMRSMMHGTYPRSFNGFNGFSR